MTTSKVVAYLVGTPEAIISQAGASQTLAARKRLTAAAWPRWLNQSATRLPACSDSPHLGLEDLTFRGVTQTLNDVYEILALSVGDTNRGKFNQHCCRFLFFVLSRSLGRNG